MIKLNNAFKEIKHTHYQTALLEAFDWDEETLNAFNAWFIEALRTSFNLNELMAMIEEAWEEPILNIVKDLIKSEIDDLKDENIQQGKIYEA